MNKKILFGSLLAVFMMLMVPSVSAVNYQTSMRSNTLQPVSWTDDGNEDADALVNAIQQRLNELEEQNVTFMNIVPSGIFNDSDGPYKGGLDDIYDWIDLATVVYSVYILLKTAEESPPVEILEDFFDAIKELDIFRIVNDIILLNGYISISIGILQTLGDAFDVIDPDGDGY